jgi:hypothetical protein
MSDNTIRRIGALAVETAVDVAWAQWGALTAVAVPAEQPRVHAIVDPEALILLSLAIRDRERRLNDLLAGWATAGSWLLSIQRLKTLAKDYPQAVREQVPDFARYAADAGDRRWRSHAADADAAVGPSPRAKDVGSLRLSAGPVLMLRLRAGIGVGAKADLLTFLLGLHGAAADLKRIALATAYSDRAMRTAAEEMTLARFIYHIEGPPSEYRADPEAWSGVLNFQQANSRHATNADMPRWHFWSVAFAFLTSVIDWEHQSITDGWSAYVASSRARDLMERHRYPLRYANMEMTSINDARGVDYLASFADIVQEIAAWTRRSIGD